MGERSAGFPGNVIVAALFAALLLAPAALALSGHAGFDTTFIEKTEHRRPFVAPAVSRGALATAGWERDVERQVADAFPLRTLLIERYDAAKFVWLHDSPSKNVIRGRDGWVFLGAEERDYLDGKFAPTDVQLARLADLYATRAGWCARHGMRYAFLLAPNKSTIYANELPEGIRLVTPSAADRLIPMLRARGVRTIDVRAAVSAAARDREVYSHGDTHWNDAGAYAAYRAAVDALRDAGVRDRIAPDSIRTHVEPGSADLYGLSGVGTSIDNPWLHFDFPRRAHPIDAPAYADPDAAKFLRSATAVDDPSLPSVVVFGDSFASGLQPFLAEDFRRAIFLHHPDVTDPQFDPLVLEAERPTVVIQELVERSLVFGDSFLR